MQANRRVQIAVAAVVVALIATVAYIVWPRGEHTALPSTSPTPTVPASPTPSASELPSPSPSPSPAVSPSPSPTESRKPAPDGRCQRETDSFVPTSFEIERVGAKERVIAMNADGGQIPAPPLNDRRSAGWWAGGPKPGAGKGKVVLTIHTYRPSLRPALGNELYDGGRSALRPGDLLKLHGRNGQTLCYEFTEAPRIFVKDYDPDSSLMLDSQGRPSAVIVICWDYNKRTKDWDSRVFFQFRQVTG